MKEADIKEKPLAAVLAQYPAGSAEETKKAEALIAAEVKKSSRRNPYPSRRNQYPSRKIIVLDDDPTGVQTVHGIPVYTGWSTESCEPEF
jgi:hypothetical protein